MGERRHPGQIRTGIDTIGQMASMRVRRYGVASEGLIK
jgi:hypothetical protein